MRIPTTSILALLAFLTLGAPSVAQVEHYGEIATPPLEKWAIPEPQRVELDNGLVLFLLEDHELPLVEVYADIRAGSRLDPVDKIGLGSILGQVLRTGGTDSMTGDEIDAFLESRGAVVETGMSTSSGSAYLSSLKEDFDEVLGIFHDVLRRPRFDPEKIELAKVQERSAIARRNDDPNQVIRRVFAKLVYGPDSPYARHAEYATIDAVERDDLLAYHASYYKPNAMILGIVGDFDTRKMVRKIDKVFGTWKAGKLEVPETYPYREKPNPGVYHVEKEDVTQSSVRIGHLGIRRDHPDYYAAEVLNELFGRGFSSRIVQSIRSDKGLAYSVGSSLTSAYDHPGMFIMALQTKSGSTLEAVEALFEEVERLWEVPPSSEELEQAKSGILNSFVFNFDDPGEVVERTMTYEYYGYPLDFLDTYQEKIRAVGSEDVVRVAKEHIHPEAMTVAVVGKSGEFDAPLASLYEKEDVPVGGPKLVRTIDVTIPEPQTRTPKATAASLDRGGRLLERVAGALGSESRLEKVSGLKIAGTRSVMTPQGGMTMPTTTYISYPDDLRVEIQTPMGDVVMVYDGEEGYVDTPGGRRPLPSAERKELLGELVRHPVSLARMIRAGEAKGQYLGTETLEAFDGIEAEVVLVETEAVEPFRLFVHPETGRILQVVHRGRGMQGAPVDKEVLFVEQKEVDGVLLPHKLRVLEGGREAGAVEIETIELSPALDAALFETES